MARARIICRLFLSLFIAVAGAADAASPTAIAPVKVFVVQSRDNGPHGETVAAIQAGVEERQARLDLKVFSLTAFREADVYVHRPALIITVGVEAAQRVARVNPPAPILHTLAPRDPVLDIVKTGRGKTPMAHRDSAIYLDQPIGRQLDLLRLALPKHRRIAAILGPATQHQAAELRNAARERSLTVTIAAIDKRDALLPTLERLLDDNDILLSVPEPLAYDGETIHHVLLTTYRYKAPMVGLSKTYVDAGALLAVYSTPEQIGRQVAQLLLSPGVAKGTLPPPTAPTYFTVSVNRRVAASLDLYLDADHVLQKKLQALSSDEAPQKRGAK